MAEPKIYSKNFLNVDNDFTVSSNSDAAQYLFDRDNDSQWTSDGEDSDLISSSIYSGLLVDGLEMERTWDTFIIMNHNISDLALYQWDGSAFQAAATVSGMTSGDAAYKILPFPAVTSQRAQLYLTATQTANQEKTVGELVLCETLLSFSRDMSNYDHSFIPRRSNDLILQDGTLHRTLVPHSLYRTAKYEAKVRFDFLTLAEIETLQGIKELGDSFLWQPESTQRPDQIFEVMWTGNFSPSYISSYKGAGYRLDMELKEV